MNKNKITLISLFLFIMTGAAAGGAAFLYGKPLTDIVRIAIMVLVSTGIVLFLNAEAREKNSLLYDNKEHFGRFARFYLVGLAASLLFPLLPVSGWAYPVIFAVMGLVSNQVVGIGTGSTFLLLSVMLEASGSYTVFFMYFISGMAAAVLFSYVDEAFRVGLPMLVSLLVLIVCIAAGYFLTGVSEITFESIFIISANILVCILLLLVFLRYYSSAVVNKQHDKYMEINDPECPILVALKQKSKAEYYQAVHTAYLSDKIAKRLKINDAATKTCGYYHKIGTLKGSNSWDAIYEVCQEFHFPPDAIALLKEYTDKESYLTSKEAIVVLFADTLVASILYLFSNDPKVQPDYTQIIEAIYQKKQESGILDKSKITMGELKEMKKLLMEEKLYYDFLR